MGVMFLSLLAVWVHDLDPFIVRITDDWGPRWYGLSYLVGFFIAYLLCLRIVKVGRTPLSTRQVGDLIVTLAIGIMVGGRLGYCLFYRPELLGFDDQFPFWGVLKLWEGGMASHGGILGGLFAALWFSWRRRVRPLLLLDLFAYGAPLGLFFGRCANFVNGELYGRRVAESFPLAVKFPQELYTDDTMAQMAYERLLEAGVTMPLRGVRTWIIEQIQAGNETVTQVVAPLLTPRHPSQLYAAVLEGLVVATVLIIAWAKPRKPGTIGALFLITYGSVRITDELWRMPDDHLGFQWLGLTRGQWLSLPLVVAGLVMLIWCNRRDVPRLGGWRQPGRNQDDAGGDAS